MKRRSKKESLLLGPLFQKIAPRIGASVFLEPRWGMVGQITFKNGRHSYFRYNTVDLNPVGAADIAKDKDYANVFMARMGYPIVPGSRTFFSPKWGRAIGASHRTLDAALRYAKRLRFPVVVKPNSGSQGAGVAVVHNRRELERALRFVFSRDRVALVQRLIHGKDYRLVVLDDEVISAYERIPLNVVGDGKSTIRQLLQGKQRGFIRMKRDTQIKMDDPRIAAKLATAGRTLSSRPKRGETVFLLDNANLSTGGDAVDVRKQIHPAFRALAVQLTRDMGLRLCGVDLMVDPDIRSLPERYWILEVNAAPGLDHYAKVGSAQEKLVESLYLKVLKAVQRRVEVAAVKSPPLAGRRGRRTRRPRPGMGRTPG